MDAKHHLRLLKIDQLIRAGGYPNCETLRVQLKVSERTLLRHVESLKELFKAPIKYSKHHNGYYYDRDFSMTDLVLTQGDLIAVLLGRSLLSAYEGTPFHADLQKAYQKLSLLLPDHVEMDGKGFAPVSIELYSAMRTDPKSVKVMQSIVDACNLHKKMRIEYRDSMKKKHSEIICPYKLSFMNGAWYLLGYHEEQKVMKTYRIRRLTRVRKLKDCFDLLTLPKEVSTAIPASEITLVKTRFSHKIADTLIDRLEGLEDKMVKNAKGDLVVEIPTADVDTTYSWLLSFGSLVEVLEPLSLRVRFRKDLVAMISMY